jgi:hypothetical protein
LNTLFDRITGHSRWSVLLHRSLVGVAAAACLALVFGISLLSSGRPAPPETAVAVARIEGGQILEGGYLSPSGRAGIRLFFNEGSELALTPGARGRLRAISHDGARLAIEHGAASFEVTPSQHRRWLVDAGPFLVTVKGTLFTVSWDPSSERFELRLRRGRVDVTGPIIGTDGIALRAGQRLVVNLPRAETVISKEPLEPGQPGLPAEQLPAEASVAPAAVPKQTPGRPAVASAATPLAKIAGGRRWAAELANGRWDRILGDVDRAGVDATLARASSDELFAIADAARYRRRTELARAALLAQRRRFPDAARSLDAMFLLARVEELRGPGSVSAIALYDQYLSQAPAGAYAAEALGRKMILTNEVGGVAAARVLAQTYLRRFPNGSYAGSARALVRAP